jgi:hypothetical protein
VAGSEDLHICFQGPLEPKSDTTAGESKTDCADSLRARRLAGGQRKRKVRGTKNQKIRETEIVPALLKLQKMDRDENMSRLESSRLDITIRLRLVGRK